MNIIHPDMKTYKSLLLLILMLFLACKKEEKNPTLDDFCNVKPTGWDCEIIQANFDKNDIPKNANEPMAIIKYKNRNAELVLFSDTKVNPSLVLDLYSINPNHFIRGAFQCTMEKPGIILLLLHPVS